jgi:magnesium-transporting ATPase (P-type)
MHFDPGKMSFGEIIDSSIKLFRVNFTPLVLIMVIFYGPALYITQFITTSQSTDTIIGSLFLGTSDFQDDPSYSTQESPRIDPEKPALFWTLFTIILVLFLIAPIGNLAAMKFLSQRVLHQEIRIFDAARSCLKVYFTFIAAVFMACVRYYLIALGAVLIIVCPLSIYVALFPLLGCLVALVYVVGIVGIMMALLTFIGVVACVIAIEGKKYSHAIPRTHFLLKGLFFRSTLIMGIVFILVSIITLIFSDMGKFLGSTLPGYLGIAAVSAIGTVFSLLFQPVLFCTSYLIYLDLRIRKENYDLEILTQRASVESGRE